MLYTNCFMGQNLELEHIHIYFSLYITRLIAIHLPGKQNPDLLSKGCPKLDAVLSNILHSGVHDRTVLPESQNQWPFNISMTRLLNFIYQKKKWPTPNTWLAVWQYNINTTFFRKRKEKRKSWISELEVASTNTAKYYQYIPIWKCCKDILQ